MQHAEIEDVERLRQCRGVGVDLAAGLGEAEGREYGFDASASGGVSRAAYCFALELTAAAESQNDVLVGECELSDLGAELGWKT